MRQCHITTFCTCSPLLLLYVVLFLQFIYPPRHRRIQILWLAFTNRFSFICIFYSNIHIWLYIRTIDLSCDIEKIDSQTIKILIKVRTKVCSDTKENILYGNYYSNGISSIKLRIPQ